MKTTSFLVATMVAAALVTGCKEEKLKDPPRKATAQQKAPAAKKMQKPPGHPPAAGRKGMVHGAGAPAASAGLSGKVLETMDAGGYSYVKLETPKGPVWAAVQKAPIKVGQTVGIAQPMLMKKFKSKTLNRSFDEIYFGKLAGAGAAKGGMGGMAGMGRAGMKKGGAADVASAHKGRQAKKVAVEKVEKAKGGYTVAEVFAKRKELASKKVIVRGKVTKFNAGIMGKNWLHLQDGTGSAADKSFDLTVTTQASAKVGDIVVIEGVLAVDKDFGAGYAYTAIVEKAAVKK